MKLDLDLDLDRLSRPGRRPAELSCVVKRQLDDGDLALLRENRQTQAPQIVQLSQRHHRLARLLAQGKKPAECSRLTGYGLSRISILQADPTFGELVAHYKNVVDMELEDFSASMGELATDTVNFLKDQLEAGNITVPQAMKMFELMADRTGHGPATKNDTNLNINLGARLDAARKRMQQVITQVEDAQIVETESGSPIELSADSGRSADTFSGDAA